MCLQSRTGWARVKMQRRQPHSPHTSLSACLVSSGLYLFGIQTDNYTVMALAVVCFPAYHLPLRLSIIANAYRHIYQCSYPHRRFRAMEQAPKRLQRRLSHRYRRERRKLVYTRRGAVGDTHRHVYILYDCPTNELW